MEMSTTKFRFPNDLLTFTNAGARARRAIPRQSLDLPRCRPGCGWNLAWRDLR